MFPAWFILNNFVRALVLAYKNISINSVRNPEVDAKLMQLFRCNIDITIIQQVVENNIHL